MQLTAGVHAYAARDSVFGGVTVSGTSTGAVWLLLYDQPVKVLAAAPGGVEPSAIADQVPMKKFELLLANVIELTAAVIFGLLGAIVPVTLVSCSVT